MSAGLEGPGKFSEPRERLLTGCGLPQSSAKMFLASHGVLASFSALGRF